MLADLLAVIGMQGGEHELRKVLVRSSWLAPIAIGLAWWVGVRVGVLLLVALLPALLLNAWGRFRHRSLPKKALALAVALAFVGLALASLAGLTPYATQGAWRRGERFITRGAWLALVPSLLPLLWLTIIERAEDPDSLFWVWCGLGIGLGLGGVLGGCLSVQERSLYPLLICLAACGIVGMCCGLRLTFFLPGGLHQKYLELDAERLARDPVRRVGLTPDAVARVYAVLARLAYSDGCVAADERLQLEAFRRRYELSTEAADRLEAEGRSARGLKIGRRLPELTLLMAEVEIFVERRRPARTERRLLKQLSKLIVAQLERLARAAR